MKLQKYKFSKDLIKYLLNSKVHVGLINYFIKSDINFYLYGFRNKVCIFNLFSTYYSLKQLFYLFIEILKKNKKIVFVFSPTLLRKHFYFLKHCGTSKDCQIPFLLWKLFTKKKKNFFCPIFTTT